jgi:hypothetical protein
VRYSPRANLGRSFCSGDGSVMGLRLEMALPAGRNPNIYEAAGEPGRCRTCAHRRSGVWFRRRSVSTAGPQFNRAAAAKTQAAERRALLPVSCRHNRGSGRPSQRLHATASTGRQAHLRRHRLRHAGDAPAIGVTRSARRFGLPVVARGGSGCAWSVPVGSDARSRPRTVRASWSTRATHSTARSRAFVGVKAGEPAAVASLAIAVTGLEQLGPG